MKLRLSYNDGISVVPLDMTVEQLRREPVWKIRLSALRRYAPSYREADVLFSLGIDDPGAKRVVELLQQAANYGVDCEIDPDLLRGLTAREDYLREKARVGLLIKAHDESVADRFDEFRRAEDILMQRPLKDRQLWDAFFMSAMGRSANFSVPGSGKTASVLGTFAYLRERDLVDRIIVLSPKNAFGSWRDEWAACFGADRPLRSLCFHDPEFRGRSTRDKCSTLLFDYKRYDMILLNYESVALGEVAARIAADRALVVFDEVHKVKRVGGKRAASAVQIAAAAPYFIALTGTPIPNSFEDLYNLLHCLWPRDYNWYFGMSANALKSTSEDDVEHINESIAPFFCRTNKYQLGVPQANEDHLVDVPVDRWEQQLFQKVLRTLSGEPFEMIIRLLQLSSDPRMLAEDLSAGDYADLFDGEVLAGAGKALEGLQVDDRPTAKMVACLDLVESLVAQGKSVIVWCIFKRSIRNVVHELRERGITARAISGSTDMPTRARVIDSFKAGETSVLVTNPHTLAESVSLHSVCHDAVYFECSYNLVHLLQSKDRIHRLGLPQEQYTQYHYLRAVYERRGGPWSLDRNIYERLQHKEQVMLDSIDRGTLEPGYTDERDLELVFKGLFDDEEQRSEVNDQDAAGDTQERKEM